MNRRLTHRQKAVLDWIIEQQAKGESLSMREICDRFGFKSPNSANYYVHLLREQGFLEKPDKLRARCIKVAAAKLVPATPYTEVASEAVRVCLRAADCWTQGGNIVPSIGKEAYSVAKKFQHLQENAEDGIAVS